MIMALSRSTTRHLHYAIHVIRLAALNLNLDRAVSNFELMLQLFRDSAKHILSASRTQSIVKNLSRNLASLRREKREPSSVDSRITPREFKAALLACFQRVARLVLLDLEAQKFIDRL